MNSFVFPAGGAAGSFWLRILMHEWEVILSQNLSPAIEEGNGAEDTVRTAEEKTGQI